MTEVDAAEALILAHMPRFPARHEPLAACTGRVLAEDIHAERDQPPFDRVTMDGVAIAFRGWAEGVRSFQVLGTQAAGAEPLAVATSAQCVEVMTGTPLPAGADTVVPVERVQRSRHDRGNRRRRTRQSRAIHPSPRQRSHGRQPRAARRNPAGTTRDRGARRRGPGERTRRGLTARRRDLHRRRARRRRQADRGTPDSLDERSRSRGQPDATPLGPT